MATEPKPFYSPGLEGVIAGETAISRVDPQAGLIYRGYDIQELASNANFEEVVWLLLHGQLPGMADLAGIRRQLAAERHLPPALLDMLRLMPPTAYSMDTLRDFCLRPGRWLVRTYYRATGSQPFDSAAQSLRGSCPPAVPVAEKQNGGLSDPHPHYRGAGRLLNLDRRYSPVTVRVMPLFSFQPS